MPLDGLVVIRRTTYRSNLLGSDQRLNILPFLSLILYYKAAGNNAPEAAFFDFDWMDGKNPALFRSNLFRKTVPA